MDPGPSPVFNPGPLVFALVPNTLSLPATICPASGIGTWRSIFLPSCKKLRPSQDISVPLFAGPTAWDAALALSMLICNGLGFPMPSTFNTNTLGSVVAPPGLTPLKVSRARPSQKKRKLYTELITDGA